MAASSKLPPASHYSVHPSVALAEKWVNELPEKTGRSIEQWIALLRKTGPATENERRDWLKREHQLGTNAAWFIAERAEGKGGKNSEPDAYLRAAEEYVREMFANKKAALVPLYDQLLRLGFKLGERCEGVPMQDDGPFLSQTRLCADQAIH